MVLTFVAIGAGLVTMIAWLLADRGADFVAERAVTVVVIARTRWGSPCRS